MREDIRFSGGAGPSFTAAGPTPCPPFLPFLPLLPSLPCSYSSSASPCARKNDRLSSDTVRSTLFNFTSGGTSSAPGEKFRIALIPEATTRLRTFWAAPAGTAMTAMRMRVAARDLLQIADVVNRHAAPRLLADLLVPVVEERRDLEAFLPEPRIVGERKAQIAGAHDRDAQLLIQSENLTKMPLQVADVVADAADAELAEVRQVLADLRGVQMELLGQRLGRNRADAGAIELVQTAKIHREAICGEFRDLIEALLGFRRLCSQFSQATAIVANANIVDMGRAARNPRRVRCSSTPAAKGLP